MRKVILRYIVMRKNVIWNAIGTTFNSFNSLFFMIIVTRMNGIEQSGIFTMAFSLACLFCIFAGYEGRVYQVTDVKCEFSDKEYIIHRYLTSFIAVGITIGYCVIMGYDQQKFLITVFLCLMKILEMLADVYYGILQKNEKLYLVGQSMLLKSVLSLLLFFLIDLLTRNLIIVSASLALVWALVMIFYDIPNAKKCDYSERYISKNVAKLFKSGFFAFSILFLSIYLVNASKYALDGRVDSALQAIYGIILMPATFLSLVVQYIIQPILNQIARLYNKGEKRSFNLLIGKVTIAMSVIGLLVTGVAWLLGIPVLNILYGVNINEYRIHLIVIIVGAVFYAISTFLSAALTTVRYTFIQFIVFFISSVFGFFISILFIEKYSVLGASLAYLAIMTCQLLLYIISYSWVMKHIRFVREETDGLNSN